MIKGSFFEFNVARSALFTAQANLQVTSHNVANAATTGYSRQYGVTLANRAMSGAGSGMYGTGSSVTTVSRHRSAFLDQKYWTQNSVHSQFQTKKPLLENIERTFTSVDSDGVNNKLLTLMSDLENVFSDLSTNANDLTFRNNVLNSSEALAQGIAQIGNALTQQQQQLNEEIVMNVNQMNTIADQIARLNKQIQVSEFQGDVANDLRDQRELLVDQLSKFVNVQVQEAQLNPDYDPLDPYTTPARFEYSILIDGTQYIKGEEVNRLTLNNRDDQVPPVKKNPMDAPGLYDVSFGSSSTNFNVYSSSLQGSLKALIDLRDGNNARGLSLPQGYDTNGFYGTNEFGDKFYRTTNAKGIPHYIDRLNELVRTFTKAVNEGVDHNGNPMDGVYGHVDSFDLEGNTGRFFFSLYDDEGNEITNTEQDIILYDKDGVQILNADGTVPNYNDLDSIDVTLYNVDDSLKDMVYNNLDWNSFTVSTELQRDPSLIATSSSYGVGESNNNTALGFASLMDNTNLFANGKMTDFIIGITSEIAVTSKQASTFESNYADIVNLSENQRIQVSGVDINEESVNMIKYQQMYQAASKLISVIDSIYDITINQLIG